MSALDKKIEDLGLRIFNGNRRAIKPFLYPQFKEAWAAQQKMHWVSNQVSLSEDVHQYKTSLTDGERRIIENILRLFTQTDSDIASAYKNVYLPMFHHPEIVMMLLAFANIETVHFDAYDQLTSTLGFNDEFYSEFLKFPAMVEKYESLQQFNYSNLRESLKSIIYFSACTEGIQLFSSFVVLLYFPVKKKKMMGLSQIISYSMRDESLHSMQMIALYNQIRKEIEEEGLLTKEESIILDQDIVNLVRSSVDMEDKFIDLVFTEGEFEELSKADLKDYIRIIADMRLRQLNKPSIYNIAKHPCQWVDAHMSAPEYADFFSVHSSSYSKDSESESEDIFDI